LRPPFFEITLSQPPFFWKKLSRTLCRQWRFLNKMKLFLVLPFIRYFNTTHKFVKNGLFLYLSTNIYLIKNTCSENKIAYTEIYLVFPFYLGGIGIGFELVFKAVLGKYFKLNFSFSWLCFFYFHIKFFKFGDQKVCAPLP
jgi:hypothetical protein